MSGNVAGSGFAPSSAAPRTRLRLTRRGRVLLTALAATPLVAAAVILGLNGGAAVAGFDGDAPEAHSITVMHGQTLWSIAEEIAPADDPRDVIVRIMNVNNLETAALEPGQQLDLPIAP